MNLYLLSQSVNNHYDTFDSMVVAAPDPETAAKIYPYEDNKWQEDKNQWGSYHGDKYYPISRYDGWVNHWSEVTVKLIGVAAEGTAQGVVLASFNAG